MSFSLTLAVTAAGGLGAAVRWAIVRFVDHHVGVTARRSGAGGSMSAWFPLGIMLVNVSGAFVLGLLSGAGLGADWMRVAGTGFTGGYTTFSTWMLDSVELGAAPRGRAPAILNIVGSLVAGLAAVALGRTVGRAL